VTVADDEFRTPISKVVAEESDIERFHQRLRKMSGPKLLRFGVVNKYMCSLETNPDRLSRESFVMQLNEAREEWNRRYPELPLRGSF
jgi:hypothetical protein